MAKTRNPNHTGSYKLRKDGRYQWTQMIDGEPRTLYAKSLTELQEKVKKVSDLPISSNKLKVDDWFQTWLEIYIKPLKKQATYDQYRILYEQHVKPVIGHRKITGVKTYDVQSVIAKMNEKKLSSWTMRHTRKVMNIGFQKAFNEKLISSNPVMNIEIPVKQPKTRKVLTIEELSKLYKAMERSRWIWSIRFMLVTGVRRGELLAIKWGDIDFANKRLTIDESNSSAGGLGDTKNAKAHFVPLSDKAITYLDRQKAMLIKEHNPSLNEKSTKTEFVFPSKNGTMMLPNSFYTMLARFAAKAEIKASPHCLRHSFVYYNRDCLSLKEIQYILGHDESTTTLDLYGDIINDSMIDTAKQIDEVFNKVDAEIQRIEDEKSNKKSGKLLEFKRKKA
ncbi:MAG: tyrosine-type recombinase/integrase [Ignavibacteriales bacterium]